MSSRQRQWGRGKHQPRNHDIARRTPDYSSDEYDTDEAGSLEKGFEYRASLVVTEERLETALPRDAAGLNKVDNSKPQQSPWRWHSYRIPANGIEHSVILNGRARFFSEDSSVEQVARPKPLPQIYRITTRREIEFDSVVESLKSESAILRANLTKRFPSLEDWQPPIHPPGANKSSACGSTGGQKDFAESQRVKLTKEDEVTLHVISEWCSHFTHWTTCRLEEKSSDTLVDFAKRLSERLKVKYHFLQPNKVQPSPAGASDANRADGLHDLLLRVLDSIATSPSARSFPAAHPILEHCYQSLLNWSSGMLVLHNLFPPRHADQHMDDPSLLAGFLEHADTCDARERDGSRKSCNDDKDSGYGSAPSLFTRFENLPGWNLPRQDVKDWYACPRDASEEMLNCGIDHSTEDSGRLSQESHLVSHAPTGQRPDFYSPGRPPSPAQSSDTSWLSEGEASPISLDSDATLEYWESNLDPSLVRIRSDLIHLLVTTYTGTDTTSDAAASDAGEFEQASSARGSSNQSSSSVSRSTPSTSISSGKHKRSDGDEDDRKGEEPNRGKRRRVATQSISLDGRLLACPYYKHNPTRFSECNIDEKHYRGCSSSYLTSISRLKQHLYRVHRRPEFYCRSCFEIFQSEDQLDDHARQRPSCEPCEQKFGERINAEQLLAVRRRQPGRHQSETWFAIFRILFPEAPLPDTPYADSVSPEAIRAFMDHFQRRAQAILSTLIRDQLGDTLILHSDQQRILDSALESAIAQLVMQIGMDHQDPEQGQAGAPVEDIIAAAGELCAPEPRGLLADEREGLTGGIYYPFDGLSRPYPCGSGFASQPAADLPRWDPTDFWEGLDVEDAFD